MKQTIVPTLTLLLLFSSAFMFSQNKMPELRADDIPGGRITHTEYFDGKSLWGYIDGGADVYMEYGFNKVLVQEIEWQTNHFKIDIYEMKSEGGAFGIFSVSRHRCLSGDSIAPWSCVTPYQIQFAKGRCYYSIVNDHGSDKEQSLAKKIAAILLKRSTGKAFVPPKIFRSPVFAPHLGEMKFMKGPLGIGNGFPDWQEKFSGIKDYSLYLLPIELKEGFFRIGFIVFARKTDRDNFYKTLNFHPAKGTSTTVEMVNGIGRLARSLSPTTIVYAETDLSDAAIAPFKKVIESVR